MTLFASANMKPAFDDSGHQKGTHAVSLATAHFNQLALLRYQSPSFVIEGFSPLSPIHELTAQR